MTPSPSWRRRFAALTIYAAASIATHAQPSAHAQTAAPRGQVLELDIQGAVARVFSSDDPADEARAVEIELRSVAIGDDPPASSVRMPAPGEVLFVIVSGESHRYANRGGVSVPRVGEVIRATVAGDGRGLWSAAGADWFESAASSRQPPAPADGADEESDASTRPLAWRGMSSRPKIVGGRIVLEVATVDERGPARDAGLQPGDVIVGIGGRPIASLAVVRKLSASPDALDLAVIDVNSRRLAEVKLAASGVTAPRDPEDVPTTEDDETPAARIARAMGVTLEVTRVGARGAVKVVKVAPGTAGAAAGLEPGDTIVAIAGTRVGSLDEFAAALPPGGGKIVLTVRDVRTGSEVPVEAAAASIRPMDADAETNSDAGAGAAPAGAPAADRAGLSTELTFYDAEAAVKIVAVKPRSPASRAGLRVGWIIVRAGDVPILHPDDLAKAEKAGGQLTLRVVDPANRREFAVTLEL